MYPGSLGEAGRGPLGRCRSRHHPASRTLGSSRFEPYQQGGTTDRGSACRAGPARDPVDGVSYLYCGLLLDDASCLGVLAPLFFPLPTSSYRAPVMHSDQPVESMSENLRLPTNTAVVGVPISRRSETVTRSATGSVVRTHGTPRHAQMELSWYSSGLRKRVTADSRECLAIAACGLVAAPAHPSLRCPRIRRPM